MSDMYTNNVGTDFSNGQPAFPANQGAPASQFMHMQQIPQAEVRSMVNPVNCNEPMQVTTIADLQSYANGAVIRLPDFAEGQPFVARVRRPSMLVLAKSGKIPNNLLSAAGELFSKGGNGLDTDSENMLGDMYSICYVICEASLISPSIHDIERAGLELSDEQLMAIFNYAQAGVKALEPFRKE